MSTAATMHTVKAVTHRKHTNNKYHQTHQVELCHTQGFPHRVGGTICRLTEEGGAIVSLPVQCVVVVNSKQHGLVGGDGCKLLYERQTALHSQLALQVCMFGVVWCVGCVGDRHQGRGNSETVCSVQSEWPCVGGIVCDHQIQSKLPAEDAAPNTCHPT